MRSGPRPARTSIPRVIVTLLALIFVAAPLPAPAQFGSASQADALDQLERLSPEERARVLEELRERGAPVPPDANPVDPLEPIDDRLQPVPLGGETEIEPDETTPPPPTDALVRFGTSLFALSPESFQPPRYGPVPTDYVLGPGDELVVEVWGEVNQRNEYRVGREGTVLLKDAGQAAVAGLTLEQARREVRRRLSRVLSGVRPDGGGSTQVDVTLGRLRSIRVFVIGEASHPGGFEVSSVATVFQALYAAGGPSEIGSMRHIQLIRDNRVDAELDLYEVLMRGTRRGDVNLRDGDTVFIPVADRSVAVEGEVRRPGIFELVTGEGLSDAVRFAGGLGPAARADLAHVQRVLPPDLRSNQGGERVEIDLPLARLFDATAPLAELVDGDRVVVRPVDVREERFVCAGGSVVQPGRYGYESGMRVSDLLDRARGVRRDGLLDRAMLVRVRDDYSQESLAIDLLDFTPGGAGDFELSPLDSLHVFSIEVMQESRRVEIHGEVQSPGEYVYFANMTLRDLVLAAGGLLESADPLEAQVSRVDPLDQSDLASLLEVPLGTKAGNPEAATFALQNHDHVFIRTVPGYELQRNVTLEGEVKYPGVYTLRHREERLSELIERAGGLLETAYPPGFRLQRTSEGVGNLGLDLERALRDPGSAHDVILVEDDSISIPARPMSVKVVGEVGFPTSVIFQSGRSIGDYIASAGGYQRHADRGRTKVIYPNGLSSKVRRWWRDPGVKPGSTIYVPARDTEGGVDWGTVIVGTTQVLSSLATIYLVIDRTN